MPSPEKEQFEKASLFPLSVDIAREIAHDFSKEGHGETQFDLHFDEHCRPSAIHMSQRNRTLFNRFAVVLKDYVDIIGESAEKDSFVKDHQSFAESGQEYIKLGALLTYKLMIDSSEAKRVPMPVVREPHIHEGLRERLKLMSPPNASDEVLDHEFEQRKKKLFDQEPALKVLFEELLLANLTGKVDEDRLFLDGVEEIYWSVKIASESPERSSRLPLPITKATGKKVLQEIKAGLRSSLKALDDYAQKVFDQAGDSELRELVRVRYHAMLDAYAEDEVIQSVMHGYFIGALSATQCLVIQGQRSGESLPKVFDEDIVSFLQQKETLDPSTNPSGEETDKYRKNLRARTIDIHPGLKVIQDGLFKGPADPQKRMLIIGMDDVLQIYQNASARGE